MAMSFPLLFNYARYKTAKVQSYMERLGNQVVWEPIFRRNLTDQEEKQFVTLIDLLNFIFIPRKEEDSRVSQLQKIGLFSVPYFFLVISSCPLGESSLAGIWKINAPPRVVSFGWIAVRGRIFTMENLRRRGKIAVDACPMCLAEEKSVDHLLLQCKVTQFLWFSTLDWFGCCGVLPHNLLALYEA